VQNNGHAIAAEFADNGYGGLTLDNNPFPLKTVTFHAKSEHTVGGKQYPLEVHLVHQRYDGDARAIVALFIDSKSSVRPNPGEQPRGDAPPDPMLEKFTSAVPTMMNVTMAAPTELSPLDFTAWMKGKFYKYEGSLTAPPCTENVVWFVRQDPIIASNAQVKALFEALFEMTHDLGNARAVLPLMDRTVTLVEAKQGEPVLEGEDAVPWHWSTRPFQAQIDAEEAKAAVSRNRVKLQDLDSRIKAAAAVEARAYEGLAPHPVYP
jgi:carbonic anhydrase